MIGRILALVVVVTGLTVGLPERALAQQDDGLLLGVHTSYEMRPHRSDVAVSLEVKATNTLSDATDEFGVTRYYFDEVVFAIPIEAIGVTATDATGPLDVEVVPREVDGISEASIALRSRLYSGQERDLTMEFTLPAGAPRSEWDIRVDSAYAWFFLWAYGDPGAATVSAMVPEQFEVQLVGDALQQATDDEGRRVLQSGIIEDPFAWVSVISARNDAALATSSFEIGETRIELEAWPSDPLWSETVRAILTEGVPVLSELTGRTWDTDLVITESIEPSIHGYGGWYVGGSDSIEIGEELDAHLVLHEISHAWFDEGLFAERWITEGLADVYADATVDLIGETGWDEETVTRSGRGNLPLNHWEDPTFDDRTVDTTEDYGYAASWYVVDRVVDEIGFDAMAQVLDAAWSDTIAYRGEAAFDYVNPRDDWRRFLDLLEEVGGSQEALSLFDTWVVDDAGDLELEARYQARSDYRALRRAAGTWALPPALRRAMGGWDFGTASEQIESARSVIVARDDLEAVADEIDLEAPSLESRFEAGEDSDLLVAELEAQALVAQQIAAAIDASAGDRSFFQTIGLLGVDPDAELDVAGESFATGQLEQARDSAEDVQLWAASSEEGGRMRVAVVAAFVAGAVVIVAGARRRRRRRNEGRHREQIVESVRSA